MIHRAGVHIFEKKYNPKEIGIASVCGEQILFFYYKTFFFQLSSVRILSPYDILVSVIWRKRMKTIISTVKFYFVQLFPLVLVFTSSLYPSSDSDLGWHLKYGEYFFKNGEILRENIYSTMMPNFPWINSSWGTDLITYAIFSKLGFLGLSLAGAGIITLIFYLLSKAFSLSFWEKAVLFPTMILMEKPMFDVSLRGHLLTLLFVSILYYLLSQFEKGRKKILFFIPPLFTIWSNIHGEFLLGLGLLLLWVGLYVVRTFLTNDRTSKMRSVLADLKTFSLLTIASLIATIIHPFGIKIYEESLKHFGNPLQRFIIEWLPFERFSFLWWTLISWELLMLVSFILMIKMKKFTKLLPWTGAPIILLILSYSVRRYTWPLILISIPIIQITAASIKPKLFEISTTIACFVLVSFYGYIIFNQSPQSAIGNMNWKRYCDEFVKCSPQSAEFLVSKGYAGKMMTFYNWGGYLIWNYPQVKPSIDGRMHLWQDEKGYSAFAQYYPYEQNWKDIDNSDYDIVYMTPSKPVHKRLMQLAEEKKWKIAYSDKLATVFVRNK